MRNATSTSTSTSIATSTSTATSRSASVVIVEIRAAEGGADAKQLAQDQLAIYERLAVRRSL